MRTLPFMLALASMAMLCIDCSKARDKKLADKKAAKKANKQVLQEKNASSKKVATATNGAVHATTASKQSSNSSASNAPADTNFMDTNDENTPVWLREARSMDLMHDMGIIKDGPSEEYPECTFVEYYTQKFEELKKKVDLDELNRFAVEHYKKLLTESKQGAANGAHEYTTTNSVYKSEERTSPIATTTTTNTTVTTTTTTATPATNATTPPTTPQSNSNKRNNNKNNRGKNNNAPLSNSNSSNSSNSSIKRDNNSSMTYSPSAGSNSSNSSSTTPPSTPSPVSSIAQSQKTTATRPEPKPTKPAANAKQIKQEEVVEIKENYLPVHLLANATTNVKNIFARHLDPLLKGDLTPRTIPNGLNTDQSVLLQQFESLIRALGPNNADTVSFIRAEFDYPSSVNIKEFALMRMSECEKMLSSFSQHIITHMEGITQAEHKRMDEVSRAMKDIHYGAFKVINGGAIHEPFLNAFLTLEKLLKTAGSNLLVADLVIPKLKVSSDATVDALLSAPSNAIDELKSVFVSEESISLPTGIKSCFMHMGASDYECLFTDWLAQVIAELLPTDTTLINLKTLPDMVSERLEAFLVGLKEDASLDFIDDSQTTILMKSTLTSWVTGFIAVAAVGQPHLKSVDAYDLDYYSSYLQALMQAKEPLFSAMHEALCIKLIGDAKEAAFSVVMEIGVHSDIGLVLTRYPILHSGDADLIALFDQYHY